MNTRKIKQITMALALMGIFSMGQATNLHLSNNPFGHALVPDMIADASISYIDGTFYCHATTDGYGRGLETSGPPVVWTSPDFVHWQFNGIGFPSAANEKYWAPSKPVPANGRYYLYPTINGYMYAAEAMNPAGPFRLSEGEDHFERPYSAASTLLKRGDRTGIDAEVFVDDDGQAYVFWQRRHAAKLLSDMVTIDTASEVVLSTPQKAYSEGPIFFKRNNIYYYLYTIGGNEKYKYYYMMSHVSPLGPYEFPANDLVTTTRAETGVSGPGHGCVFNVGEDYYIAFLEFGRGGTNRQTYVNRLEFNSDGTIRPVKVSLDGVGALSPYPYGTEIPIKRITASSVADSQYVKPISDPTLHRVEYFSPQFASDHANGSRWMALDEDSSCWLVADLGRKEFIGRSEIAFVRPTAGHAYRLEGSVDGRKWTLCGGHDDIRIQSPHVDEIGQKYRYLRLKITSGVKGVWEWQIYREGSYTNPILPADFSDIDCIRVGKDYYAISSTFQFSPGMAILHSTNLVDWEICGHAVNDLTQISPHLNWDSMDRYARGIWAGTLRYHKGKFYLVFGTPDEGYFITTASKPEGEWSPLHPLLKEAGWDDCTLDWDESGTPYFVGTCFKDNYKTYLFR
ncbi:MAG: family 43 glycosylhydrolase, partial [Bacteroidota bacterium]|nr:family 43 glycosylhydrolase [Bacteroidota bacterium]